MNPFTLLSLLGRVPGYVWVAIPVLVAFGCTSLEAGRQKAKAQQASLAAAKAEANAKAGERAIQAERELVQGISGVTDELSKTQALVTAQRRAFDERVRAAAAASRSGSAAASATAGGGAGPTVAGELPDEVREDLATLMEEADRNAGQLRACQALSLKLHRSLQESSCR